jgi:peptidoglycan/LPS O-acetylase OafA/YrhL
LVPAALATGIGQAWSLTAELCFYLVLPLFGLLAWRVAGRVGRARSLLIGPGVLIACGLVVTAIVRAQVRGLSQSQIDRVTFGHNWTAVLDRSLLSNADLFGYGMLAALGVELLRRRGVLAVSARAKFFAVALAVLITITALEWNGLYVTNIFGACAALCIGVVVLPSPQGGVNAIARVLEWKPLRYVGLISYSLYLWHEPVIMWLKEHGLLVTTGSTSVALAADLLIVLAVALVLASATYYVVEKPAMQLRRRLRSHASRPVVAVNMPG